MKVKLLFESTTLVAFALLGVSAGYYKHQPFGLLYYLKNGAPYFPSQDESRNYDTRDKTVAKVDITKDTGIYLTYGQSNSANHGEIGYRAKKDVYQFAFHQTYLYEDPSLGATGRGGSVWGMVGDKLIKAGLHDKVIFANSGWGGKSIHKLKEGSYLEYLALNYRGLIDKYGRVDAVLFHQGEKDNSPKKVHNYYGHFIEFVSNLKKQGIAIPIYLSRTSFCGKQRSANKELTEVQDQLIKDLDLIKAGPNTDTLNSSSHRLGDYCHFSLEGYDRFSDLWVEHILHEKNSRSL